MGVSYPKLGTFSPVMQLCIVVSFSCSSCIVSVLLPFWYLREGKLSELNAENNVGSSGGVGLDWYIEPVEGGGRLTEQVMWKKMTDLGVIKCDGESNYKQCGRMKETGAKVKTCCYKCEHLDRGSGVGDDKRMREEKKRVACGTCTEFAHLWKNGE